jgi:transposase
MDEGKLEALLFSPKPAVHLSSRAIRNWEEIHRELKGKGMTLFLLCEEYKEADPDGYQYSWFCQEYRKWTGKLDLVKHMPNFLTFNPFAQRNVNVQKLVKRP